MVQVPHHEATIAGIRCIDVLFQLFGDDYGLLCDPRALKALETLLTAPLPSLMHKRCILHLIYRATVAESLLNTAVQNYNGLKQYLVTLAATEITVKQTSIERSISKLATSIVSTFSVAGHK